MLRVLLRRHNRCPLALFAVLDWTCSGRLVLVGGLRSFVRLCGRVQEPLHPTRQVLHSFFEHLNRHVLFGERTFERTDPSIDFALELRRRNQTWPLRRWRRLDRLARSAAHPGQHLHPPVVILIGSANDLPQVPCHTNRGGMLAANALMLWITSAAQDPRRMQE